MDLVEERDAAVLARRRAVDRARAHRVAFGHRRGVEGARRIDHVDHAAARGAGLLHHPDRLGAAAHLDGEHALAGLVRLLDVLEEAARIDQRRRKNVRRGDGVLRGRGKGRKRTKCNRCGSE